MRQLPDGTRGRPMPSAPTGNLQSQHQSSLPMQVPGFRDRTVVPERVAEITPSHPVLSSHERGWHGITLQRYVHDGNRLEVPGIRRHALSVRLAGQALLEERVENGPLERRWTESGRISLLPAGQSVMRSIRGKSDVLLIYLLPELVDEAVETVFERDAAHVSLQSRVAVPEQQVDRLGRLLLAEAENGDCGSALVADMLAHTLTIHLLRRHSSLSPSAPEDVPSITGSRLRRTLEYMRASLSADLTLAELAEQSGLSQPHFARAFRTAVGMPPHRYLIMLRIEKARELLEWGEMPIIEVAMKCGFQQPTHFAATFHKHVGMSPRTWRHMRRL